MDQVEDDRSGLVTGVPAHSALQVGRETHSPYLVGKHRGQQPPGLTRFDIDQFQPTELGAAYGLTVRGEE
ncbi:MAG: hypothetical protein ACYSU3_05710 [Planctomycetota bacterium]